MEPASAPIPTTQAPANEEPSSAEPAPANRRVRALPVPQGDNEPGPSAAVHTPAPQAIPALPPEARLEDSKTVYVVSDIVDALRADAGYEPLPRDPAREAAKPRRSFWSRIASWFKSLR